MKTIRSSILAIALAVFAFAAVVPDAQAVPANKVPGTAYHDGQFDNPGVSHCVRCGEKFKSKSSDCTVCDSCMKKQNSGRTDDRKPYWKKKIGI